MGKAIRLSYEYLDILRRVATHLACAEELHAALQTVLDWLTGIGMQRGVITLITEDGKEVQAHITVSDMPASRSGLMRYKAGEGITGKVFASGVPIYLPQLQVAGDEFLNRSGLRAGLDLTSLSFFCVPIIYHEHVIGTLSADKHRDQVTDSAVDREFLMEVGQLLAPFVQRQRLESQLALFQRARRPDGAFAKLIGKASAITELQRLMVKVAEANTTVLIMGETGTGKGVTAEVIHQLSSRRDQPFVEVNCGAIPETLIESELFGHEKGAFTGATQRRVGVLERAGHGTVFLDEIGELPASAQTRLLRVLQKREFERVGGTQTLSCAARIVAATNRDLEAALEDGSFRSDLFYRLNVFPIHLPPLRERGKADIMLLVDHFIQRFSKEMGKTIARIDTPAIDMLTAYHWPGNVRELENVIERAVLLADAEVIHGHHLPPSLQMNRYAAGRQVQSGNFESLVSTYEIDLITDALKDCNGNQSKAAERLGLTKRIMQYKIQKYDIDYRRFR